jgi:hypothetical protein
MALGLTQPLRRISTRNLPGGKWRPARKADNLTAIWEPTVSKMWDPRRLTNLWASTSCCRDNFTFFYFTFNKNCARRIQSIQNFYHFCQIYRLEACDRRRKKKLSLLGYEILYLKMDAAGSSKTLVTSYETLSSHNPKDHSLHAVKYVHILRIIERYLTKFQCHIVYSSRSIWGRPTRSWSKKFLFSKL